MTQGPTWEPTMIDNLTELVIHRWAIASPAERQAGRAWYGKARQRVQEMTAVSDATLEQGCAVVAALSPRLPWQRNLLEAGRFLQSGTASVLSRSRAHAEAALVDGLASLEGRPKTYAFGHTIYNPRTRRHIVLDVWMLRVLGAKTEAEMRRMLRLYAEIEDMMIEVAAFLRVLPATLQATLWINERGAAA